MGWTKLRLFAPEKLEHQFMLSPVDEALQWLDAMNGREPKRSLELANDWAARRIQFAAPIRQHQAIEFMLADMAVEIMAAKSVIYRVAWEIDQGIDRKIAHARASVIKLHASEMAGRVLDRAVQIFGGRGYMRENAVERLSRDVRVDRIWEGTSEIQRAIIGGQLGKRGPELFTGWHR